MGSFVNTLDSEILRDIININTFVNILVYKSIKKTIIWNIIMYENIIDEKERKKEVFIIFFIVVLWGLVIMASIGYNYYKLKEYHEKVFFQSARNLFKLIIITREWNAKHNGIYVVLDDKTKPNPFLKDKFRDLSTCEKIKLTKINPAYMTREISELTNTKEGIRFHITSLNPIRPMNNPNELEEFYLKKFHREDLNEIGKFIKKFDRKVFFYMAPLKTQESCLKCHGVQGYNVGDIRGGISIEIPDETNFNFIPIIVGHLLIGGIGGFLIFFFLITLISIYEKVKTSAYIDELTQIPNRKYFFEKLKGEFNLCKRNSRSIAVIMCDIDYFKRFNDEYGHLKGDECLTAVANAIKKSIYRTSDFCARYGGEEFIVILPEATCKGAIVIAERIKNEVIKLNIPHINSPHNIVTLSIGITCRIPMKEDLKSLLQKADEALYMAKEAGRNKILVYKSDEQ